MTLPDLLFSPYRQRVLSLLLLHPGQSYHLREIARLTDALPGTLQRELQKLTDAGVLASERVGNQVRYRANTECPIFPELAGILRKTCGLVDVLAQGIAPLADRTTAAFVFGSMASGTARADSDIDLMVIGDVSFAEVVAHTYPLQEILQRQINPKVYTLPEWCHLAQEGGGFVREVLAKPRIRVAGGDALLICAKEGA